MTVTVDYGAERQDANDWSEDSTLFMLTWGIWCNNKMYP